MQLLSYKPVITRDLQIAYHTYKYSHTIDPSDPQSLQKFQNMLYSHCEYYKNDNIYPYTQLSLSQLKHIVVALQTNTYYYVSNFQLSYFAVCHPTVLLNSYSNYWDTHKFYYRITQLLVDNSIPGFISTLQFKAKLTDYYKDNYDLIWQDRNLPLSEIVRKINH